jgi:phospholipid/cholesterol/gamma-HCH transport system ATP-binding protein
LSNESPTLKDAGPQRGEREAVIELENVVAGYGSKIILEDLNLSIHRGQITALLGGSGSGKSTLLKTMIGLLPPLSGQVRLLGEDLYRLELPERARLLSRTGMLFQYGALFGSRTVYDNVALPLRQHTRLKEPVIAEMVRMKLALVGLEGLEERLPSDISGGQRKRVALARATILDPEIVFADEPSAGLDPIVAAGLDDTLRRFQRLFGMTMVVVTHELESIKALADYVIMLARGAVEAQGTIPELMASSIENVHNFFHRVPPRYVAEGSSMLEWLEGEP